MIKTLKADFYKIFKSKMLLAFFIITLSFSLLYPVLNAMDHYKRSVYAELFQPSVLSNILWIFVIPFASKDYSSKYMKNLVPVYSQKDRLCYILSKVFYIFVFCVLFMLLNFVFDIITNYAFGKGCMHIEDMNTSFTIGEFYLFYVCSTLNCVAMGTFILFLCTLVKKEYIVTIIVLPYIFFLGSLIYNAIDKAVGGGFRVEIYTIFGVGLSSGSKNDNIIVLFMSLAYTVVFTVSSWLVFRKRSL